MDSIKAISLDALLGAAGRGGQAKSVDAAGSSDGQKKRFKLPDDVGVENEPQAEPTKADTPRAPAITQPRRPKPDAAPEQSDAAEPAAELAVNPQAVAAQPEPAPPAVPAVPRADTALVTAVGADGPALQENAVVTPHAAARGAANGRQVAPGQIAQHATTPPTAAPADSAQQPAPSSQATPAAPAPEDIAPADPQAQAQPSAAGTVPATGEQGQTSSPTATTPNLAADTPAAELGVAEAQPTQQAGPTAPAEGEKAVAQASAGTQPEQTAAEAPTPTQNTAPAQADATPMPPAGEQATASAAQAGEAADVTPAPSAQATRASQQAGANEADASAPPPWLASAGRSNRIGSSEATLSGMARENAVRAASEPTSAEVDANLQAQAGDAADALRPNRQRLAALSDGDRPSEAVATQATAAFEGARYVGQAEDSSAPARPAPAGEAGPPMDQILANVRQAVQGGRREITIQLTPPELGRVRLRMYTEGDGIRGRIEVDNPRTLHEIRHQTELLAERLAADGIALRRLEVHSMGQSAGQGAAGQWAQHDASGQMSWQQSGGGPARGRTDTEALVAASAGLDRPAETGTHDGGLNVWI